MEHSSHSQRFSFIELIRQPLSLLWNTFIEFIWSDLRDGMIDLRGLSRPILAVISLGILVTVTGLVLLTQTPALRATFPLYTSITPAPGRGLHIPLLLFPLSLFLLSLAWAYLLVGARQSHWLIRTAVFVFYTLNAASWIVPLLATNPTEVFVVTSLYLGLLLLHFLPQAKRLPLAFGFILNLIGVGAIYVIVQYLMIQQDEASGLPIGKTVLESNLRSLATLAIPLLILIGIDVADFTIHAATWINQAALNLLPTPLRVPVTFTLLAWLLWQGATYFELGSGETFLSKSLLPLVGTAILLSILWLSWSLLARMVPSQRTLTLDAYINSVAKVAALIVIALLLPLFLAFLFLEVALLAESLAVELRTGFYGDFPYYEMWASSAYSAAISISATINNFQSGWQLLCAIAAIVVALILYRRSQPAPALFTLSFGINYIVVEITRPGRWLQSYGWTSPEALVFAWSLLIFCWAIVMIWRRQLTPLRLSNLLLACLILALLRQTSLITSPLDPLFALAGVGYLAVGLGWDLLTAGSWTNHDSPALPRASRIFLYLGYILLTVMLINWATASHDFTLLARLTGEAALTGLVLLGYPYLFSVLYLLLTNREQSSQ